MLSEIEQLKVRLSKLSDIVALKQTDGWKYIVQHFSIVLNSIVKQLLVEKDDAERTRLQERHRAFISMLEVVGESCKEYDATQGTLERMESEQQYRDQYDLES